MCLHGALRFVPFNLIMQHDYFKKIKSFDFLTPRQGLRVCVRTECLLAWCSILLIYNMTTFRKKMFLPFDPIPGAEGVCKDRI